MIEPKALKIHVPKIPTIVEAQICAQEEADIMSDDDEVDFNCKEEWRGTRTRDNEKLTSDDFIIGNKLGDKIPSGIEIAHLDLSDDRHKKHGIDNLFSGIIHEELVNLANPKLPLQT